MKRLLWKKVNIIEFFGHGEEGLEGVMNKFL